MAASPELLRLEQEVSRLSRRLERERAIRIEAEAIAEKGLRDLYDGQCNVQLLESIATRANQDGSVVQVLQFALEKICAFDDWKVGHGFIISAGAAEPEMRSAGIWFGGEDNSFGPFRRVSHQSTFTNGVGLPGRVWQWGCPVWISDLAEDRNFPRMKVALTCGLRSAVALPVFSGSYVVAVLEFFDVKVRERRQGLLDVLVQAGTQLGRVIERQRAQDALEARAIELVAARDAAECADHAKSAFLATMSHELRTPLNAIIGFSELMEGEMAGFLSARYKDYAGDIRRSGMHLKKIIDDILDLSKIAEGALTLREAPVVVADLVESCERIVRPLAAAAKVILACQVPAEVPLLQADETRLKQTILNVLSNAVKFTPANGAIRLNATCEAEGLTITVSDTGIGMSAAEIAAATEPFRQIDSSLARRYEGTGLGLPLAKAFAELHGGRLVIESTPDVGTTVRIMLPRARCLLEAA